MSTTAYTADKIAARLQRTRETWHERGQRDGELAATEVGYPMLAKAAMALRPAQRLTFERPDGKRPPVFAAPGALSGYVDIDRPNELPEDFRWDGYRDAAQGYERADRGTDLPPDRKAYWRGFADAIIAIADAVARTLPR